MVLLGILAFRIREHMMCAFPKVPPLVHASIGPRLSASLGTPLGLHLWGLSPSQHFLLGSTPSHLSLASPPHISASCLPLASLPHTALKERETASVPRISPSHCFDRVVLGTGVLWCWVCACGRAQRVRLGRGS